MKKILFLDRDGCLIQEPQPDQQVDSLEKLEFMPGVLYALARIVRELDYTLVMVTNQDGLGTSSFPEETFWPAHQKMLKTFENEGIIFYRAHIDRSFKHQNLPTRKPGTAMLTEYFTEEWDLGNSWVVGDRLTDMQLAQNLGARGILLLNQSGIEAENTPGLVLQHAHGIEYSPENEKEADYQTAQTWEEIYQYLRFPARKVIHQRTTRETNIQVTLNLDGQGESQIHTGLGFFDHMLDQLAKHGQLDIFIKAQGDLWVDEHHTIEDVALTLGEAFGLALGDKKGVERYGFTLPMDEALAQVAVDFGGRPWIVWDATFAREKIGDMPTEMFFHFFKSFSDAARCNLNIRVEGQNEHHKIEAIFKAFAKAVKMAVRRDPLNQNLPSTKGIL
ncbi:MAG TPA: bifunctional histidinol-phosphatase/imidazoleglycerol-phosphate dehydratase HisB [Saprospiraceae bacterium]|nr:bifunctional histidinol-phosphatase/imidazoleglycerol-phosphate dehydratase HisB [Saprospiraceae bacterium]